MFPYLKFKPRLVMTLIESNLATLSIYVLNILHFNNNLKMKFNESSQSHHNLDKRLSYLATFLILAPSVPSTRQ